MSREIAGVWTGVAWCLWPLFFLPHRYPHKRNEKKKKSVNIVIYGLIGGLRLPECPCQNKETARISFSVISQEVESVLKHSLWATSLQFFVCRFMEAVLDGVSYSATSVKRVALSVWSQPLCTTTEVSCKKWTDHTKKMSENKKKNIGRKTT